MKRILVTGGLGTVGKVLVRTLRGRGHAVKVSGLEHYHADDYVRCDVASFMQVSRLFEENQFDYVYHLAAEFGRWNGEDYYDKLWMSNAVGTKNMIRMQQKQKFRLIHFSSSEVYGDYDGVMTEDVVVSISALEHWSYCRRQCALIHVEQIFEDNVYTIRGHLSHERVDSGEPTL